MRKCLFCYQPIENEVVDFHNTCSLKIVGEIYPPSLPYSLSELELLANEVIQSQTALTGVQAKLSLHITGKKLGREAKKFTIVGLWGGYILKPPTSWYPELPQVEDLTMHLAQIVKIKTAPHSLIRLSSGELAYITQRVDRTKKGKLAMEDMCQLTERLTEDKYHSSYEQIAKTIQRYSATPGLDVVNFFELVLFSYLTGNANMHLKNFSLLEQPGLGMVLSPAYDLVNTALVNSADKDELALTLNGKKRKINWVDFVKSMSSFKIDEKQQQNIYIKMTKAFPQWFAQIDNSFLSDVFKEHYKKIVNDRLLCLQHN